MAVGQVQQVEMLDAVGAMLAAGGRGCRHDAAAGQIDGA